MSQLTQWLPAVHPDTVVLEPGSGPARSCSLCAVHVRQFEGASPLSNLMEVKD